MWIWLDKTGRVKQYLTHGPSPVVGETDFQIFAYFDGLDTDYFDSATIKFRKPDQQGSTYPVLFMRKAIMPYEYMPSDGSMSLFSEEHSPFTGFLFDFSDFTDGDEIVRLLDTPGLWEATITCLGAPNKTNVSGLITFNVGDAASDNESQTELTIDQVLENLVLAQRILKKNSAYYLRVTDNFIAKATNGQLDIGTFIIGSIVYDETTNDFYKIQTITVNEDDKTKVFATYIKTIEFVKFTRVFSYTTLSTINKVDNENVVIAKYNENFYLVYVSGFDGLVSFEIKDLSTGRRYHSDSISSNTSFADAISSNYYVPGTYYTPHVSEDGYLSWTNNNNEPNPETVNIRGPQGIQGIQGQKGDDALGALAFKIGSDGHLIMCLSNESVNRDLHVVNDNPESLDYWETLGATEDDVGHLIFVY